jgi:hypothetical protein
MAAANDRVRPERMPATVAAATAERVELRG